MRALLSLAILILVYATGLQAETYTCPQPDGSTLFTDQPGPGCTAKAEETTPNRRPLYWCNGRVTFGDIRDSPLRDECEPLRAKKIEKPEGEKAGPTKKPPSVKLDPRRQSVDDFLSRYRQFVRCCASRDDGYIVAGELEEEASALLEVMESNLSFSQLMTLSGRGIVIEVATARDRLRAIIQMHEKIDRAYEQKQAAGFEQAGMERVKIRELEGSLEKLAEQPPALERAKTGLDIGYTPGMGPAVGSSGRSGDDIGKTPARGEEIGKTPPTGEQIGRQPPRGPEIGTTPPTGAAIGNSSFNRPE